MNDRRGKSINISISFFLFLSIYLHLSIIYIFIQIYQQIYITYMNNLTKIMIFSKLVQYIYIYICMILYTWMILYIWYILSRYIDIISYCRKPGLVAAGFVSCTTHYVNNTAVNTMGILCGNEQAIEIQNRQWIRDQRMQNNTKT